MQKSSLSLQMGIIHDTHKVYNGNYTWLTKIEHFGGAFNGIIFQGYIPNFRL